MKITFPHLGNTYICVKAMLDEFGVDYVIPPFNSNKTLELGSKYAPEMSCLPLKLTIGNLIQAHEMGADTILMAGGFGPCRFGYYCQMQKEILKDAGYEMDLITLEASKESVREIISRIRSMTGISGMLKIPYIVAKTARIAKAVDEIEALSFKMRAVESKRGSVDEIYRKFRNDALHTTGIRRMSALIADTRAKLMKVPVNMSEIPLRIGIVGEIYTGIEQFASFGIQEKLGLMGAEADRKVTVSNWIIEHIIKKGLHLPRDLEFASAAEPWLGKMIGGHAQETLGHTVLYARDRYDGVIQIFPFSCMPEIVAESIIPSIENELGIPVLTLIIDEMTGEAGYMTRVEAFVDMLRKRRESEKHEGEWLLSWN